ncbi:MULTISPECIES: hypothetical protein [Methylobacteriaceae]|jgi:hypothetical protein|uniref:Uncharacterized protein n=1 Tax=Methylobacterium gregans TaxID=374424 RepID=A0AA37HVZ5_9HYPH|nr:hypothetical protein [Methylobacterium gregans]MDQ0522315.1 hypothetical protein [Methylobacterium gregans]GJD81457.1 hypothetical protein NBEOAGPD_4706 [Methylobacterium gregans]GLS55058.1 hypothetical protein GCM10007886_32420 [Methylobacterium gregans]
MLSLDDIAAAAAGEERDALWRSVAEDMEEAAGRRRGERGFVRADRPADLARALGRDRRGRQPRRRTG